MVEQLALEAQHVVDRNLVHQTLNTSPDGNDLLLHRIRRVLRLAEQLHQPPAPIELATSRRVEVGGEHRKGLHVAVLGELQLERARNVLHCLDLGRTTDTGYRDTNIDRWSLIGVEEV